MVADFGLPYRYTKDLIRMAGPYIDLFKIAVGTSRLYDLGYLRRKLALYRKHRVRPFIGGQFQEYVFATYGAKALRRFLLDDGLRRGLDMSRVLIELPGPWISGVTLAVVEDMKKFLVREFGPDVDIANVMPHDIMETEALRVGLGVVGPNVQAVRRIRESLRQK